jgi:hypothetical protein
MPVELMKIGARVQDGLLVHPNMYALAALVNDLIDQAVLLGLLS